MKRKTIIPMLSLALIALASCGGEETSSSGSNSSLESVYSCHTHTYDKNRWEYDESCHYHPTTCGHESELKDDHVFIDDGEKMVCAVCGYSTTSAKEIAFQSWKKGVLTSLEYSGDRTTTLDYSIHYTIENSGGSETNEMSTSIKETVSEDKLFASNQEMTQKQDNQSFGVSTISTSKIYDGDKYLISNNDSSVSSIVDRGYMDECMASYMFLPTITLYCLNGFMSNASNYTDCPEICASPIIYSGSESVTDCSVEIEETSLGITLTSKLSVLYINDGDYTKMTITDKATVKDDKLKQQEILVDMLEVDDENTYTINYSLIQTYDYSFDNDFYTKCNKQVKDNITDDSRRCLVNFYLDDEWITSIFSSYNGTISQETLDKINNVRGNAIEYYLDEDFTIKYENQPLTDSFTKIYMKVVPVDNTIILHETYINKTDYLDFIPEYLRYDPEITHDVNSYDTSEETVTHLSNKANCSNDETTYTVLVDGEEFSSDMSFELGVAYDVEIIRIDKFDGGEQIKDPSMYGDDD